MGGAWPGSEYVHGVQALMATPRETGQLISYVQECRKTEGGRLEGWKRGGYGGPEIYDLKGDAGCTPGTGQVVADFRSLAW